LSTICPFRANQIETTGFKLLVVVNWAKNSSKYVPEPAKTILELFCKEIPFEITIWS
jgi:hypothetical protein